jgi:hypothetical protein
VVPLIMYSDPFLPDYLSDQTGFGSVTEMHSPRTEGIPREFHPTPRGASIQRRAAVQGRGQHHDNVTFPIALRHPMW